MADGARRGDCPQQTRCRRQRSRILSRQDHDRALLCRPLPIPGRRPRRDDDARRCRGDGAPRRAVLTRVRPTELMPVSSCRRAEGCAAWTILWPDRLTSGGRGEDSMLDGVMLLWFVLMAAALLFVAIDIRSTPESPVLKWGFVLLTAYTGVVGAFLYVLGCREPLPGLHERYVA